LSNPTVIFGHASSAKRRPFERQYLHVRGGPVPADVDAAVHLCPRICEALKLPCELKFPRSGASERVLKAADLGEDRRGSVASGLAIRHETSLLDGMRLKAVKGVRGNSNGTGLPVFC
jgi:hypothetical protein